VATFLAAAFTYASSPTLPYRDGAFRLCLLHYQISSSHSSEDTLESLHASARTCPSYFFCSIGLHWQCCRTRQGCVYIHPAELRAFSTIQFGRHSLTHPPTHHDSASLYPVSFFFPLTLRHSNHHRSCYRLVSYFASPTSSLPTLAPPLHNSPKSANWPTTRPRQSRP
jgi:hypothetical protein